MSNKLLGLLIVLGFIMAAIGFYMYAFVNYTGTVVINTNVVDYKVELNNIKTFKKVEKECSEERCELQDVSPFEYNLRIIKENYRTHEEKLTVVKKQINSIVVALEKDTKLVSVDSTGEKIEKKEINSGKTEENGEEEKLDEKEEISIQEKLKRLRDKQDYFIHEKILNFGEIFFREEDGKLKMYFRNELGKEKVVRTFTNMAKKSEIQIQEVYGDDNRVYIEYQGQKYIYNSSTAELQNIALQVSVLYVKKVFQKDISFVTEKGTFIYNQNTKKLEYFSMFHDFVYTDGNYIGVIDANDEQRKINLNYENETGEIIVLYNSDTKEKRILLKPIFEVEKIIEKKGKILMVNAAGQEFSLENY